MIFVGPMASGIAGSNGVSLPVKTDGTKCIIWYVNKIN